MQKSIKNQIKNFLIVTLSVLMMMPNTVAAFAKEGTDEKKIEKLELSTTYDDYDIVATTEKDSLPEGAKLHVTEVTKLLKSSILTFFLKMRMETNLTQQRKLNFH